MKDLKPKNSKGQTHGLWEWYRTIDWRYFGKVYLTQKAVNSEVFLLIKQQIINKVATKGWLAP